MKEDSQFIVRRTESERNSCRLGRRPRGFACTALAAAIAGPAGWSIAYAAEAVSDTRVSEAMEASVINVPDSGATAALLGLALFGVALVSRRKRLR